MEVELVVQPWSPDEVEKIEWLWAYRTYGTRFYLYDFLKEYFNEYWEEIQDRAYRAWSEFARNRPYSALAMWIKARGSKDRALRNLINVVRTPDRLLTRRMKEYYKYIVPWFGVAEWQWGVGTILALMLTNDYRGFMDAKNWAETYGGSVSGEFEELCPEKTMTIARQCILIACARWGPILLESVDKGIPLRQVAESLKRDIENCLKENLCRVPEIEVILEKPLRVRVRV